MPEKKSNIVRLKAKPNGSVVQLLADGTEVPYAPTEPDWDRIDAMSDEDIARQVADNPDAAPLPPTIDVKAVRSRTGLSQDKFARVYGFKAATLRNWEQGRTLPDATTVAYLTAIKNDPVTIAKLVARG